MFRAQDCAVFWVCGVRVKRLAVVFVIILCHIMLSYKNIQQYSIVLSVNYVMVKGDANIAGLKAPQLR